MGRITLPKSIDSNQELRVGMMFESYKMFLALVLEIWSQWKKKQKMNKMRSRIIIHDVNVVVLSWNGGWFGSFVGNKSFCVDNLIVG